MAEPSTRRLPNTISCTAPGPFLFSWSVGNTDMKVLNLCEKGTAVGIRYVVDLKSGVRERHMSMHDVAGVE